MELFIAFYFLCINEKIFGTDSASLTIGQYFITFFFFFQFCGMIGYTVYIIYTFFSAFSTYFNKHVYDMNKIIRIPDEGLYL